MWTPGRCSWASFTDRLRPFRFSIHYWYLRVFSSDGFPYVIAPAFSTPAFFIPAIYSRIFHSHIFSAPTLQVFFDPWVVSLRRLGSGSWTGGGDWRWCRRGQAVEHDADDKTSSLVESFRYTREIEQVWFSSSVKKSRLCVDIRVSIVYMCLYYLVALMCSCCFCQCILSVIHIVFRGIDQCLLLGRWIAYIWNTIVNNL